MNSAVFFETSGALVAFVVDPLSVEAGSVAGAVGAGADSITFFTTGIRARWGDGKVGRGVGGLVGLSLIVVVISVSGHGVNAQ